MFNWIRRMFRKRTVHSRISDNEEQHRERIRALLRDNPDVSDLMRMLGEDFVARSRKRGGGSSSSSPISSP